MAQKGLLPNFGFGSQQIILCRDRVFWLCVTIVALYRNKFWLGPGFLGFNKGFLSRDRAS